VGWAGYADYVADFAAGSAAAMFSDSTDFGQSAFDRYDADFDDTYLIDGTGQIRYYFSAKSMPFDEAENQERIDDWVHTLLSELP
jgi:hypothetical protein